MVNVDTVYQKVLALLNKEQRGYMTPQEYNLLADKAQKEIFESYFAQPVEKTSKNQTDDKLDTFEEKLAHHKLLETVAGLNTLTHDIGNFYKIQFVKYQNSAPGDSGQVRIAQEVSEQEALQANLNPLTAPTEKNRVYYRNSPSIIAIQPATNLYPWSVEGWKAPIRPIWGYVVVNEKPLYNPNASTNFNMHESEEEHLVNRILELAGVVVQKPGLIEIAKSDRMLMKQEQNS
jgi:hypothetical protein